MRDSPATRIFADRSHVFRRGRGNKNSLFKDDVADLAKRAISAQAVSSTAKNAIVMPFLRVTQIDVFDPTQVIPEYVAGYSRTQEGQEIDYAIKINDQIEYLVEAKAVSVNLRDAQYSQLFRYTHLPTANIGILTNGLQIWFFADLRHCKDGAQIQRIQFDLSMTR